MESISFDFFLRDLILVLRKKVSIPFADVSTRDLSRTLTLIQFPSPLVRLTLHRWPFNRVSSLGPARNELNRDKGCNAIVNSRKGEENNIGISINVDKDERN